MVFSLRIEDYTYDLPAGRIAMYPLKQRDQSRLLVYRQGRISESCFDRIDSFLEREALVILNNTRVVQARLVFRKKSGARIEVFCLEPLSPVADVNMSLGLSSPVEWCCLVGNAKKWKSGVLELEIGPDVKLFAEKLEKKGEEYRIRFSWQPSRLHFGEVLETAGLTPLPPYIDREAEADDKQRYQTIFARDDGSVAAPTAGLHFTEEVFDRIGKKGIRSRYLTLHVGAGTFKPVSSPEIGGHQMHQEQFRIERQLLEDLHGHGGQLVCVGTTSMRTVESLYWIGIKILNGYNPPDQLLRLEQWMPYQYGQKLPARKEALEAIMRWMDAGKISEIRGDTSLMIAPGYPFQMTDALITNFHQPASTLLLLVAAFAGKEWKEVYQYALDNGFRFLSYGDSCLFFRATE